METALNPNQTSPRHVLLDRADEELAHAYEQLTRADEEMARAEEKLSKLEQDAARTAAQRKRSLLGGHAVRGFTGFALAACIFAAAMVSQSSYGDTAKQIVARWAPRLVATASLPPDGSGLPAQLSPRVAQANAAQTGLPPQSSPQEAAPTTASMSPELTQLLQSMARDLATLGQGIAELKTRQEQMARDNANAVEQLKAGQDQMARVIARASEAKAFEAKASETKASETKASETKPSGVKPSGQNVRPKISAPPPRRTATSTHGPVPTRASPQSTARP
jgi:hypothetical protein